MYLSLLPSSFLLSPCISVVFSIHSPTSLLCTLCTNCSSLSLRALSVLLEEGGNSEKKRRLKKRKLKDRKRRAREQRERDRHNLRHCTKLLQCSCHRGYSRYWFWRGKICKIVKRTKQTQKDLLHTLSQSVRNLSKAKELEISLSLLLLL